MNVFGESETSCDTDAAHQWVLGPRPGRMRDRRARGPRGPLALPGPLSATRVPRRVGSHRRFDIIVETVVAKLEPQLGSRLPVVEVVIDHVPILPEQWDDRVPLCSVFESDTARQLVVFRRPHLDRAANLHELTELTWSSILYQLAQVWHSRVADLDPRQRT